MAKQVHSEAAWRRALDAPDKPKQVLAKPSTLDRLRRLLAN